MKSWLLAALSCLLHFFDGFLRGDAMNTASTHLMNVSHKHAPWCSTGRRHRPTCRRGPSPSPNFTNVQSEPEPSPSPNQPPFWLPLVWRGIIWLSIWRQNGIGDIGLAVAVGSVGDDGSRVAMKIFLFNNSNTYMILQMGNCASR